MALNKINTINDKYLLNITNCSQGLFNGKLGLALYFYISSRLNNSEKYCEMANSLFIQFINDIQPNNFVIDIEKGLAGVGLGVRYLIKEHYIHGDINIILKDIDDIIFKKLSYEKYFELSDVKELIQVLFYINIRINDFTCNSEQYNLFKELIIFTTNNLYRKINKISFDEPLMFNMNYIVPQILYVLGGVLSLNICNERIIKILNELIFNVSQIMPRLNCHKLYMMWGVGNIIEYLNSERYVEYYNRLVDKIDFDAIFYNELRPIDLYFNNGLLGIYYLINFTKNIPIKNCETNKYNQYIINIINTSYIWDQFQNNEHYLMSRFGLWDGFCGLSLFYQFFCNKK